MSSTEEIVAEAAGVTSESPTGNDNQAEGSTFDLVKNVLEQEVSPTSNSGEVEAKEQEPAPAEDKTEEDPLALSDEDRKTLSAKSQQRFQKLADQVKHYSTLAKDNETKAQHFDRLVQFSQKHSLSADDIDGALDIAALMRSNPAEAFKRLGPIYQQLAQTVGAVLPPDLAEQVRQGYISEAHAKELAQTKAQLEFQKTRQQAQTAREQEENQRREAESSVKRAVDAAEGWRAAKAKNDPDWIMKQQRVADLTKLRLLESGSYPKTEREVIDLCEASLKQVEEEMRPFISARKPITPVASSSSPRSAPEPKNSLDVVKNVLSGMA